MATTVRKTSKINFYKFVQVKEVSSTSVSKSGGNVSLTKALNKNTVAINRIGLTLNSIAKISVDLKKVILAQYEASVLKPQTFDPSYTTPQKKKQGGGRNPITASLKVPGFLESMMNLLGSVLRLVIGRTVLKWLGDPKNQQKITNVLEVMKKIVTFIFKVAKFGVLNTINGLYDLLKDDATPLERVGGLFRALTGLGTLMLGMRWLRNPTRIITDFGNTLIFLHNNLIKGKRGLMGRAGALGLTAAAAFGGYKLYNYLKDGETSATTADEGQEPQNKPEGFSKGGAVKQVPQKSMGGWISGSQSGYPVSLDGGRSTSFIGHGTEYVARKSDGGAFVVPFNTPGTKTQPHLTDKRLREAKSLGYRLPDFSEFTGYSQGGLVGGEPGRPRNPKNRKIFLHWSGGSHNSTGGLPYHQVFDGAGRPNSTNVNYGVDKHEHTGGYNTDSVALGAAAMGHGAPTKPYNDARGWRENPLTNAQTTAMAKEAAALMKAYGQGPSDVIRNVWTHGEWERYAVKTGKLNPPVQRWDLDSLTPGPYNHPGGFFTTQQVRSKGGDQMRAKIKAYLTGSVDASGSPIIDPSESGGRGVMSRMRDSVTAMTRNVTGGNNATRDTSVTETQAAEKGKGYGYGALLDLIGKRESDSSGGYDAVNQVGTNEGHGVEGYSGPFSGMSQHGGKKLTSLTVKQVMDLQSGWAGPMSNEEWISKGKLHAVGRYQFIGPTLASLVSQGHAKPGDKFNESTQNKLAVALIKQIGTTPSRLKGTWIGLQKETDEAVLAAIRQGGDSTGGTNGGGISSMGGDSSLSGSTPPPRPSTTLDFITGAAVKPRTVNERYSSGGLTRHGQNSEPPNVSGQRSESQKLKEVTDERNEARQVINERTSQMVNTALEAIKQSNGVNAQIISQAQAAIQQAIVAGNSAPQPQIVPAGGGISGAAIGGAIGGRTGAAIGGTAAAVLNSFNNPLKGIFR